MRPKPRLCARLKGAFLRGDVHHGRVWEARFLTTKSWCFADEITMSCRCGRASGHGACEGPARGRRRRGIGWLQDRRARGTGRLTRSVKTNLKKQTQLLTFLFKMIVLR